MRAVCVTTIFVCVPVRGDVMRCVFVYWSNMFTGLVSWPIAGRRTRGVVWSKAFVVRGSMRFVCLTTRSFEDPTLLIQPVLPAELRDLPTEVTVQDEESENER